MNFAYKMTTHGRAVMAACMDLEEPFKITRVAFGSGRVAEDAELADVHELISYVSDGAVTDRYHEGDRLRLTIQYANSEHPDVKMFMLSEFIVYVRDPDTGENTDLLYGTLGDYCQPVPAYSPSYPPSVFNFPLDLIISGDLSVSVSAPAGLVTHDELIQLLNSRASGAAKRALTIPASSWSADLDTGGTYPVHLDIASAEITEDMIPVAAVLPQSLSAAIACGLCPACRTLPGLLRFYAKSVPASDIPISLALLDTVPQGSGLAGSAAAGRLDIEIPVEGWTDSGDALYPYSTEIRHSIIDASMTPLVAILPEFLEAAVSGGMSPVAETLPGALRVFAKRIPEAPIRASLALLHAATGITGNITGEGGGAYALPVASKTQLGMVKLGDGLTGTPDGTVSVDPDKATDKDVEDMLGEVYPDNN